LVAGQYCPSHGDDADGVELIRVGDYHPRATNDAKAALVARHCDKLFGSAAITAAYNSGQLQHL